MPQYPTPVPGLVIRYSYLWKREFDLGRVEGQKHRPCVVVLCVEDIDGAKIVTVAPITHSRPDEPGQPIELTPATRRRLGLDADRCWIVTTELNQFQWPGPDLTTTPSGQYEYGELPAVIFKALKERLLLNSAQSTLRT